MTYALGRRVEAADMPAVRRIIRDAAATGLQDVSAFVKGVIDSAASRWHAAGEGRADDD